MNTFLATFKVKWCDVDPYQHLRNSVYQDYGDHTRIEYFSKNGYPFKRFIDAQYGPVILKTSCEYLREVLLDEHITLDCHCFLRTSDYTRWGIQHNVRKEDKTLAAVLKIEGGFLDLRKRKLITPDEHVKKIMYNMPKTNDFRVLHMP